jgi:formylmethanofuran dehydrogenase subunit E
MAKEMTIAWKWIKRLDENSSPSAATKATDAAVAVVEERGNYVYIFKDGSSIYEKRRGDWYPAGDYVQCPECEEYFNQDNATSGDILCDQCVEARADAVEEAEEVSD